MSYTFTDINFFPSVDNTTIHILDESNLTGELRKYLQCEPSKGRLCGDWVWNAPKDIRRTDKEPGYALAYTNLGMGHWNMLYWNHATGLWHVRVMGGANGHDATEKYMDLLENGFEDDGMESSLEAWMNKFSRV